MNNDINTGRREFVLTSTAVGAGLSVGVNLIACDSGGKQPSANGVFNPSLWLTILPDNEIIVVISKMEMGQGVTTGLAAIVAEELDADWSNIKFELAEVSNKYGSMETSGSSTIRRLWLPLRKAGAAAREMLIAAAAQKWSVDISECHTRKGVVYHELTSQKHSYGELVKLASNQSIPENPELKQTTDFNLIGKALSRIDDKGKITGTAVYGIDIDIPDLKIAAIRQAPVFGSKLLSVDRFRANQMKGIIDVVQLEDAVAVVADTYWQAQQAVNNLSISWSTTQLDKISSEDIRTSYQQLLKKEGVIEVEGGERSTVEEYVTVEASYEASFQAHAPMEPMNCTAHVHENGCDIWVPSQDPQYAIIEARSVLKSKAGRLIDKVMQKTGLREESIKVHSTAIGGGFGRRLKQDYVAQAVEISKITTLPVKLIWSREEDIQHDFYRPYTVHALTSNVTDTGNILNWEHRIVGPDRKKSVRGADSSPYQIDRFKVDYHIMDFGVPIGSWRSVGKSQNTFVRESFMDEIAHKINLDPYLYRLSRISNNRRLLAVANKAAEIVGWQQGQKKNQARGIALNTGFGSYIAQISELSIDKYGVVNIDRIVCVVDCGIAINPQLVKAQIEGGIAFGLSATIKGEIEIEHGRVKQSNFNDFPILTFEEMPEIQVHIMASNESPGGIGEASVPVVAPSLANAIFSLTGVRHRKIPFKI